MNLEMIFDSFFHAESPPLRLYYRRRDTLYISRDIWPFVRRRTLNVNPGYVPRVCKAASRVTFTND